MPWWNRYRPPQVEWVTGLCWRNSVFSHDKGFGIVIDHDAPVAHKGAVAAVHAKGHADNPAVHQVAQVPDGRGLNVLVVELLNRPHSPFRRLGEKSGG